MIALTYNFVGDEYTPNGNEDATFEYREQSTISSL